MLELSTALQSVCGFKPYARFCRLRKERESGSSHQPIMQIVCGLNGFPDFLEEKETSSSQEKSGTRKVMDF
jgi:hypothetical protein